MNFKGDTIQPTSTFLSPGYISRNGMAVLRVGVCVAFKEIAKLFGKEVSLLHFY